MTTLSEIITNKKENPQMNTFFYYLTAPIKTNSIFLKNYNDMKEANTIGADKYFHSLANCQSAQQASSITAFLLSAGREITDGLYNNPIRKKLSFKDNFKDCYDDWNVDMDGLKMGKLYPKTDCRILVNKYRPKGLNAK